MRLPTSDLESVTDACRDTFIALGRSRIFVTGGTGFFGKWLLETFAHAADALDLDSTLVVLSRDPESFARQCPHLGGHPSIELVRGDVAAPPNDLGSFDAAIHAATAASLALTVAAPRTMAETIVRGTSNVLDLLTPSGAIPMLFTSSGAVYGAQPSTTTHVAETWMGGPDPLDKGAVYGEGKRMAEMMCALTGEHEPQVRIARCFAFVGPHLPIDAHFAVGNFIRDALRGGPIVVGGDGTPHRSYMYGSDLAVWLWTMLMSAPAGRAFNVGSEESITIADTARCVADAAGGTAVEIRGVPHPDSPASRYVPSTLRARSELGLDVTVPLADAVRRTLAWHRSEASTT